MLKELQRKILEAKKLHDMHFCIIIRWLTSDRLGLFDLYFKKRNTIG